MEKEHLNDLRKRLINDLASKKPQDKVELSKEELNLLIEAVKTLDKDRKDINNTISYLQNEHKLILESNSIKVTKPLRKLGAIVKNLKKTSQDSHHSYIQEIINKETYIMDKNILVPYLCYDKLFKSDKIRVGLFIKDYSTEISACPYIRIHDIFKRLSNSDSYVFFLYGMDSYNEMNLDDILKEKQFDVIVVQRILPFLDKLLEKAKAHGIKIIYETDDDLLNVEKNSPSFSYIEKYRADLVNLIDSADMVTTTTPVLASKFGENKVSIVRNYLTSVVDIASETNCNEKIKIGYYGTLTHTKDLFLLKDIIIEFRKLMKTKHNIDFDFEIIGGFNSEDKICEDWYSAIELPEYAEDYEKFMKWLQKKIDWDIGVVPLEDSEFNSSKSELKFIELTAMGVPAVYSDVEAYNSVVNDGVNGFLASSKEEWLEKLEKLVLDKSLRCEIRENALKDVLKTYTLDDRVEQWDNILSELFS